MYFFVCLFTFNNPVFLSTPYPSSPNPLLPPLFPLSTANPSLFISAAAQDALAVLCSTLQYNGLPDVVTNNADIITDELCRQLRALGSHPGAPAAMAAVMQVTGAPRALLPLMAEPVHHALQVCGTLCGSSTFW